MRLSVVNYFEKTYLGAVTVNNEVLSNQQCSRMFAQSTSDTVTQLCYLDLFVLASDGWCFDS